MGSGVVTPVCARLLAMPLSRDDAHRLVDGLDAEDVPTAVALLRQLSSGRPVRTAYGFDSFDGDEDLAARSSEILRHELGGTNATGDAEAQTA